MIDPVDFKYGLRTLGVEINEDEVLSLLKYFDPTRSGKLSINEMLHAMRSNSLNETRQTAVEAAYNKVDVRGGENVTMEDLLKGYSAFPNPEY